MKRIPTVWVASPDDEDPDDDERSMVVRLREPWCAVERDQLVLPVTVLERDGSELDEPTPALLMQYGGESLLNDLLMASDGQPEAGSKWLIQHSEGFGRTLAELPDQEE